MAEKSLSELVRTGDWNRSGLKAEFRRRSLLVHPDTSGLPGATFVALQKDFAEAEAWLEKRPKPVSPATYDFRVFCELLRQARSRGLPSRVLAGRPGHAALVRRTVAMAALVSADLATSVEAYLSGSAPASPSFDQALVNFLDATLFHAGVHPRTAAMIRTYLDEVRDETLEPLVRWLEASLTGGS